MMVIKLAWQTCYDKTECKHSALIDTLLHLSVLLCIFNCLHRQLFFHPCSHLSLCSSVNQLLFLDIIIDHSCNPSTSCAAFANRLCACLPFTPLCGLFSDNLCIKSTYSDSDVGQGRYNCPVGLHRKLAPSAIA